ncbi:MAG: cell division protein FtsB [Cyclobacteriaceae bacterium]|jgi:cell division protein FtsB
MIPGRWLIAGLVLIVLFLQGRLWIGEGSLAQVSGLQVRVERESAENSIKEQRNRVLRAEIVELKSGLESIEEKARSEFGLIKEGETFFLLVDESKSRQP